MKKTKGFTKKIWGVISEGGGWAFIKLAIRRSLGRAKGSPFQMRRQQSTEGVWSIIEPHLSKKDRNVLDIGCDAGLLTSRAAEYGLLALGIDKYEAFEGAKEHAYSLSKKTPNLGFIEKSITPENIDSLPSFDVIFLLSVYHYWYREFGRERAEKMLGTFKGTRKIFFSSASIRQQYTLEEGGGGDAPPPFTDHDKGSVVEYHSNVLRSVLGSEYEVTNIGEISYKTGARYILAATRSN